jgi:tetratricopeptide (TPR) repeat protein
MLQRLALIAILAFATAFVTSQMVFVSRSSIEPQLIKAEYIKKDIIRCGPDWESLEQWLDETDIPVIPGAGNYKWLISTKNDSAQFYFNQGINMYYSFHIIESMASFKKAAKFDPGSAIIYWAQALAYGPNINDLGYAASPAALQATQMANSLSASASNIEKALIGAMTVRYTADSADAGRAKLNREYTAMMKAVYEKFPANADAQALYADAMMLEHPWDLWNINGTPKSWTPLIREVLEKLLVKTPDHPGANHYYIHVMEASPFAGKALPSADRLGKLTPGLSHTVHMPSHIYLRTGQYQKGVTVNEDAVNSYKKVVPLYSPVTGNDFLYVIHNLHMQTNNAMMAGLSETSVRSAMATAKSIPADYLAFPAPMGSYVQYLHMTGTLVNVRFGKWAELLAAPQPEKKLVYSNILYHFGRGMAFVGQSNPGDAGTELKAMREFMKDSSLYLPFSPFSPAIDGAVVAENLLAGSIALVQKDHNAAVAAFSKAVTTEENMVYNEPRDWLLNPKHWLGNAYLQAGKPVNAEKVFSKDLLNNNGNGWALYGIYQALLAQNKNTEANKMRARFMKAFKGSDVKINAAVFDR